MTVRGYRHTITTIQIFIEIAVKQESEISFRENSSLELPRYGYVGSVSDEQVRDRVVSFTGISHQEFDQAVKELKEVTSSSIFW